MGGGIYMTDYRPRCTVNAELYNMVKSAGMVQSSYDSRMFLQHNAEKVMQNEFDRAVNTLAPCAPCLRSPNDPGTMAPDRYVVRCDAVSCSREEVNPFGIGDGRNYK
jgi:hypothetical protein